MKKVALIVGLMAVSSSFAGTAITSGTAVTTTNCTLITESVTPRLSSNVFGGYNCNTTTNYIGIGTASSAGKGKSYGAGNKGGSITSTDCASVASAAQTCANSAADTAAST